MLTERRSAFIQHYAAKLLNPSSFRKLLKDPSIAYKVGKSFLFDKNLRHIKDDDDIFTASIPLLARLAASVRSEAPHGLDAWLPATPSKDVEELGRLLELHGSDKSTHHDYYRLYGALLERGASLNILEVGLGTNNLDIPSNMGVWGRSGASLRAFRDWAPNANVFGADVDERILFSEDGIQTFWVDRKDEASLRALANTLSSRKFDLIIDDGLHLPHANLNTVTAFLPLLSNAGTFVVEDINPAHEEFWTIAAAVLARKYESCFAAMKSSCVLRFVPGDSGSTCNFTCSVGTMRRI